MSARGAGKPDRIARAVGLPVSPHRWPNGAQVKRVVTFFLPLSVLMLMALSGLVMRALLSLTQGMH